MIPPSISDWLMGPRLAIVVITGMWPFMALPLEFTLSMVLLRQIVDSLRPAKKK